MPNNIDTKLLEYDITEDVKEVVHTASCRYGVVMSEEEAERLLWKYMFLLVQTNAALPNNLPAEMSYWTRQAKLHIYSNLSDTSTKAAIDNAIDTLEKFSQVARIEAEDAIKGLHRCLENLHLHLDEIDRVRKKYSRG